VEIRVARIDKLKEEIGWLKIIFGVLIATNISLVAWLVQSYGKATQLLLIACVIVIFLVTLAIVWVNRAAYRKIDELEEL
jgi:4-hydroxybenzoate polyprenyltransferase